MAATDNLVKAVSMDEIKRQFPRSHISDDLMQDHVAGNWVVLYNKDITVGFRAVNNPDHSRYGLHVQGLENKSNAPVLEDVVSYAKNLSRAAKLPYVYFATDNLTLVDNVKKYTEVEEVSKMGKETIYRTAV